MQDPIKPELPTVGTPDSYRNDEDDIQCPADASYLARQTAPLKVEVDRNPYAKAYNGPLRVQDRERGSHDSITEQVR